MSRSPEAKERDRLAAIARRAARKTGAAPAHSIPAEAPPAPVASAPTATEQFDAAAKVAERMGVLRKTKREARTVRVPSPAPVAKRGGARKGAGAPAGTTTRMRVITFKGTDAHYVAFMAAGAGAWLRGVLDAGVAAKHIKVPK